MIVNVFTGKNIKEDNLPISPDDVEFVTLGQYEALQNNLIWLVKQGIETASISRAKGAELLGIALIDLDTYLDGPVY